MAAYVNLEFYSGIDQYSDGLIENEILEIVQNNKSFEHIIQEDNRWPILYHLSSIRENILNWYPFKEDSSVLEIGGGCGAISGLLCKKNSIVKVVELSKKRSEINYERHKEFNNLEIIVGNLNDISLNEKFDYITLIGVLEYAGSFTNTNKPYEEFLLNIKKYLKDDGKLLIAIENRYGLKYFSGAKEDHTSKVFDGIMGYPENKSVRTFGKIELEELLSSTGYKKQEFYYPHPDYKLPLEIYSQNYLPKSYTNLENSINFDTNKFIMFDEGSAFKGIIENNQYEFFANSFFIECGV